MRFVLVLALVGCSGGAPAPKPGAPEAEKPAPPKPEAPKPEAPKAAACVADPSWLQPGHAPPTEVGGNKPVGDETNCDFYTFAWQWFLADMQMSTTSPNERVWETFRRFNAKTPAPQCANPALKGLANFGASLVVRTTKPNVGLGAPILPADMGQATGNALYDQAGNVVLYSASYTESECQASEATGYLPNTTEIKASWRVLAADDPQLATWYHQTTIVPGFNGDKPVTLGLVGFHLVINTPNHPEFVWATWEHDANAPDCASPQPAPPGGWSFTSAACAACLAQPAGDPCTTTCAFNQDADDGKIGPTGKPDQVCRQFPDGQAPGGSADNKANIDALNAQLVGPNGLITKLPDSDPLSVLKHYKLVGGLWTVDGKPSTSPQAGSLQLANTTLETFIQKDSANCFTCHNYTPGSPASDPKGLCVSHMIGDLVAGVPCSQ